MWMVIRPDETREDRLYLKALKIRYEGGSGFWLPIVQHLALRGYTAALRELGDWRAGEGDEALFGTPSNRNSPAGLYRRAFRSGDVIAANNAAVSCFNRNDMSGYRSWLRLAANAGDTDSCRQLRYFELRLPHARPQKIKRLRPAQTRDEWI
jgi:hypothetical protein